jgi:hypothetical protein
MLGFQEVSKYFVDFQFCLWYFRKMTPKFWFHLHRFEISKFQTWQWQKLKKSISQLPIFLPSLSQQLIRYESFDMPSLFTDLNRFTVCIRATLRRRRRIGSTSFRRKLIGRLKFGRKRIGRLTFGQKLIGRLTFGRKRIGRLTFGRCSL